MSILVARRIVIGTYAIMGAAYGMIWAYMNKTEREINETSARLERERRELEERMKVFYNR